MLSFIRRSLGGGGLSKYLAVVVLADDPKKDLVLLKLKSQDSLL